MTHVCYWILHAGPCQEAAEDPSSERGQRCFAADESRAWARGFSSDTKVLAA